MKNPKSHSFLIRRVKIRNYKSIGGCDVELNRLTMLVGPNGSGKSNFLDALNFVSDALITSLDHALRSRGGIKDVRRRSHGRPNHFTLRIEFVLDESYHGHYAFTIGAKTGGGFEVLDEECRISADGVLDKEYFRVKKGEVTASSFSVKPSRSITAKRSSSTATTPISSEAQHSDCHDCYLHRRIFQI